MARDAPVGTREAALWLLVVAAALLSAELGGYGGGTSVAVALGAGVAALATVGVVLAWTPTTSALLSVAGLGGAGAAAVHFAVAGEHFEEWWGYGLFFVATGWAQLIWAAAVVRSRRRWLLAAGLAGNLLVVGIWVATRTSGLPVGPSAGTPEGVSGADALATAFELVAAGACAALLARPALRRISVEPLLLAAAAVALFTVALAEAAAHGH